MSGTSRHPDGDGTQVHLGPLVEAVGRQGLGVRAIHVHRAGTPEKADAVHRFVEDTVENVYSVSKTVTALGVGIAAEEGLLAPDDLLVDHLDGMSDLPREALGEGVDRIRLRHLLSMTGGSPVLMFEQEERDDPDPAALFLGADVEHEPGSRFVYSNGGVHMLARVVEARSGLTLRDYLMPRLFEPLGIVNPQWHTTVDGSTWGATGLHLRSGDMARIGALLLARGTWSGVGGGADGASQQLVPGSWIDRLHAEAAWVSTGDADPENRQYGWGVWRCTPEGAWRADGAYGQFLVVLPEQGAVVTVSSRHEDSPTQDILRAIWEHLLPQL
ncbi:serine hydrolase domain-containing protein [Brachybacterium hainanense]|uniref:Serine hydrolase domain-containing protein n=1 Tax=Brachybacterium hainanense TaxID=1541174 RepID=A0ABV6RBK5_9MICO